MSDDVFPRAQAGRGYPRVHPGREAPGPERHARPGRGPIPTPAEQQREAQESRQAHDAQGDLKDRLVEIGKAGQMAGRGGRRVGDS